MSEDYITLREYEIRHSELATRIVKIETELNMTKQEFNTKLDKLLDKFDQFRGDMYSYRNSILLRIIGWGISFVVGGGGMIGLLQVFHLLK